MLAALCERVWCKRAFSNRASCIIYGVYCFMCSCALVGMLLAWLLMDVTPAIDMKARVMPFRCVGVAYAGDAVVDDSNASVFFHANGQEEQGLGAGGAVRRWLNGHENARSDGQWPAISARHAISDHNGPESPPPVDVALSMAASPTNVPFVLDVGDTTLQNDSHDDVGAHSHGLLLQVVFWSNNTKGIPLDQQADPFDCRWPAMNNACRLANAQQSFLKQHKRHITYGQIVAFRKAHPLNREIVCYYDPYHPQGNLALSDGLPSHVALVAGLCAMIILFFSGVTLCFAVARCYDTDVGTRAPEYFPLEAANPFAVMDDHTRLLPLSKMTSSAGPLSHNQSVV